MVEHASIPLALLVDSDFYFRSYPDTAASGLSAVEHYMAEGWTSAMVLEAGLRACGWPCSRETLARSLATVNVDTRGLRGGPIEMAPDNHYRKATYYKVYRWDTTKNAIVSDGGWSKLDIK